MSSVYVGGTGQGKGVKCEEQQFPVVVPGGISQLWTIMLYITRFISIIVTTVVSSVFVYFK